MSGLVELFAERAAAVGYTVHRGSVPEIDGAGVSRAIYALADTGSVVLAASPEEPRQASLLPWTHLAIVREDTILPGLAELFEMLGDDLPSALAIVSGPSRTGDIERVIAVGVHGPGEVHVAIVAATD